MAEILLESRKFRVERRVLDAAADPPRTADFVIHPGAAVILPLLADDRVLLIRNHRPALGRTLLELPAGTLDPGEPPEAAAARELEEETGFTAGRLDLLTSFFSTPGICNEQMFIYVARELQEGPPRRAPGEQITNQPMNYHDALESVRRGEICDAKTMITFMYYELYVRGRGA